MNENDLLWQASNFGGISPRRVALLLEYGHLDLVIRAAAERGEWFCAERAAERLCLAGEYGRALDVMEPFVVTGWRRASYAKADILLRAGRTQEALDLLRPDEADRSSKATCVDIAVLLARAGCIDDAIDLLVPHVDAGWWILSSLVEITEGQNRDERMLDLLAPHAARARDAHGDDRWRHPHSGAQELQAWVLERAGRADEAIRILGQDIAARRYLDQNTLVAYAELLARHSRFDELRGLAGREAHTVLRIYAGALRDRRRVDESEAVMREALAADDWVGYRAWLSSMLLGEGRLEDAIEVAEPGFGWSDCSNLLAPLVHRLIDRPEDLLRLLEHPSVVPHYGHEEFQHCWRAFALAELGRIDEAIVLAEADPRPWTDLRIIKAGLLSTVGRFDEAAAELRELGTIGARGELFEVLVRQGRAVEAIAVHPTMVEQRAAATPKSEPGQVGWGR